MSRKGETIKVCLFCGGRGSAALIRDLLRRPEVGLSLLVNAYDDGLSTGALREFIPGMLGPSDFRKNMSYLLDLYSAEQYALQRLFEYRMPLDFSATDLAALQRFAASGGTAGLQSDLQQLVGALDPGVRGRVQELLGKFFGYFESRASDRTLEFADCSFGNLIFAGAFLEQGNDFNKATQTLAEMAGSRARLVNVSKGENRTLVGLKADGTLLRSEAMIVGRQSAVPILETFFLAGEPDVTTWQKIAHATIEEKINWLRRQELPVAPSEAAVAALSQADIVIYGPGTQHSSLLPSYRIAADAIVSSPARIKAYVVNLRKDLDIQGLTMTGLADKALQYLNDPGNVKRPITHILYNAASARLLDGIGRGDYEEGGVRAYKGALVIEGDFENPVKPTAHSGFATIGKIIDLAERAGRRQDLDVYVDLVGRSLGYEGLLNEMLEINWGHRFRHVTLSVNHGPAPSVDALPASLAIRSVERSETFSEVGMLLEWLFKGDSEYLATISGDGEYRLSDILLAVAVLDGSRFGALYGSRTQSRLQFQSSLRSAYGEGGLIFRLSWLGAFAVSALLALRLGLIFSDPLTGFRLYRRSRLLPAASALLHKLLPTTPTKVTKALVDSHVEIAEIPVRYRTFTGFTDPRWRFQRGLKSLAAIFA